MADHKSAVKQHRQSLARRGRNRAHRSRLRTSLKKLQAAIGSGDAEQAGALLTGAYSLLDKTAKLGAIKGNAAARKKSRLARAVQRISAA